MVDIIIAALALIVSIVALRENYLTRRSTFRPLLIPARVHEFINDDNLFSCNFEYPITNDILGEPKLVYFGIRNIGKGPANNVRVLNFQSEEEEPQKFRVGTNVVKIPEQVAIPFVIRVSMSDESENFTTFITTVSYEDLFGKTYYLNIRLWINRDKVSVVEYNDLKNPKWNQFVNVIWREVERNGYFETRKLEDELTNSK